MSTSRNCTFQGHEGKEHQNSTAAREIQTVAGNVRLSGWKLFSLAYQQSKPLKRQGHGLRNKLECVAGSDLSPGRGTLGGISELQPTYKYHHYICRQVFNIVTLSQTSWEVAVPQGTIAIFSLAHREEDSHPSPCCSALWAKRGKTLLAPS